MFLPTQRHELPDHFLAFANPTRLRILERLGKVGENIARERAQLDELLGIKGRVKVPEEVGA
jgi:hypothetical protein